MNLPPADLISPVLPTRRPENIRASCDNCAKSKVRCSKQQPQCERCFYQGVTCTYSPSRRTRKRPPGAVHSQPQRPATADGFRPRWSLGNAPSEGADPIERITNFNKEPSDPDWQHFYTSALSPADIGNSSTWNDLIPSLDSQSPGEGGIPDLPGLTAVAALQSPPQLDQHGSIEDHSKKGPHSPHEVSSGITSQSQSARNCSDLAISTIQNLDLPMVSCPSLGVTNMMDEAGSTSAHWAASRRFDTILQDNQAALDNVLTILRCPCSAKTDLAILLTTVCSRVLSWYQASLNRCTSTFGSDKKRQNGHSNSMTSPAHSSLPSMGAMRGAPPSVSNLDCVCIPSIKIGGYTLGHIHSGRMVPQLILTELVKVGEVVDAFSRTYSARKDDSPDYIASEDGGGKVHLALEAFLRNQLKAAVLTAREQLNNR
ncbi:hypothetical protein PHISCL_08885 [Aspergillus sclerotialis]|uniref:Zn(2)-C6 fungal-type domain-containing protein n=1 Tax=Aspergillus sclerotialis TaxID=2070753 RepID=A0A3A2ZNU7_9EURO|nr:hypothetical protein PHISCL_08885 [Aspergillus sclerotialis]